MYQFFIIYPPGLETIGKTELIYKFKNQFIDHELIILDETFGGILISCPLIQGLALNTILKCPSRILLRIDEFKCRDTPKLFNKLKKIPWNKYLLNQDVEIESSAIESRLFDSRKISQTSKDAIVNFFHSTPQKKKYLDKALKLLNKQSVYIRLEKDICTVSIDTSGEHLHFRGRKTLTGLAPIRENIACALLYNLIENLVEKEWTIIDPMCGSGTFLIEASLLHKREDERIFMYENLPIYMEQSSQFKLIFKESQPLFKKYLGFDINDEIIDLCRSNIKNDINISKNDIFSNSNSLSIIGEDCLVIVNPPYGIRVKSNEEINSAYYTKIVKKIWDKFRPKRLGIIVPCEYQLNSIVELEIIKKTKFKNGGIPVFYYLLESK